MRVSEWGGESSEREVGERSINVYEAVPAGRTWEGWRDGAYYKYGWRAKEEAREGVDRRHAARKASELIATYFIGCVLEYGRLFRTPYRLKFCYQVGKLSVAQISWRQKIIDLL